MITLTEYQDKKAKIDRVKAEITRLEGSEDQLLATLKKDFGVSTLKDGDALLVTKKKELKAVEDEILALEKELETVVDWSKL